MNDSKTKDAIPFQVNFAQIENINISEIVNGTINEGIEVKPNDNENDPGGRVSYNPNHNDGVDSSVEHNPTQSNLNVSAIDINPNFIKVYSIMQRVALTKSVIGTDGNPLLYAFKNEKGFRFDSDKDKAQIKKDIHTILGKFVDQYFTAINDEVATIVIPSGNKLNDSFAGWFTSAVKKRGKQVKVYSDVLDKLDTEVIRDEVLDDARSDFNRWIGKLPTAKALKIKQKLIGYLEDMDSNHGGTFSYHFVKDPEIRNHMSMSMKMSKTPSIAKEYGSINECHVLLLDDSVSRGASMREAYNLLVHYYHPKSITGLVLFSPDQKTINMPKQGNS